MGASGEEAVALEKVTALFKTEKGNGWDEWEVLEMDVSEKLGHPTRGRLVIAATRQGFDFRSLLGKSCLLALSRGPDRKRYFKGLVFRIEHRGEYPFGSVARVDFATAAWAMQHGQDSRVFENQTAPQILEEVFREALTPLGREARLNLSRTYAVREYCVQYKESDWNFVQRLMTDEGITFYIDDGKQEADRETLVLVDSNDSFPEIETMGSEEPPVDPLPPSAPVTRDLRLRLNIDPADARHRHDRFTLIGRGAGGYRRTLSLKDDQRPGDEYVDLIFPGLSAGMRYSLQMTSGDSKAPQLLFSDVPFEQLFEE